MRPFDTTIWLLDGIIVAIVLLLITLATGGVS